MQLNGANRGSGDRGSYSSKDFSSSSTFAIKFAGGMLRRQIVSTRLVDMCAVSTSAVAVTIFPPWATPPCLLPYLCCTEC